MIDEKGNVRMQSGCEVDAFHPHHHHHSTWKAGVRARVKRGYARRNRRAARAAIARVMMIPAVWGHEVWIDADPTYMYD